MGTLTIPPHGRVYLDACSVIYSVEKVAPYNTLLRPVWEAGARSDVELITSELALLETLVKPLRDGDAKLEGLFRRLLTASRDVQTLPITLTILDRAARIRADYGLKTPDAIHAASALDAACISFLTNDPTFERVTSLPVVVLSRFVSP